MNFPLLRLKRHVLIALTLISPALIPSVAHASPVFYTVSLNGTPYTGTATIELASTPTNAQQEIFNESNGNQALLELQFSIAGQLFTLAQDAGAEVIFQNGALYDIAYAGTLNGFNLQSTNSANFVLYYGPNDTLREAGTYGPLTPSTVAATPEPDSLLLLGTGITGVVGSLYRRRRAVSVS